MTTPIHVGIGKVLVDTADEPAIVVIDVRGQLDESNVDDTAQQIHALIHELPDGVIVIMNFANLTYMNSKSIGYITYWLTALRKTGGELILSSLQNNVLDIITVVGLTQIIKHFTVLTDAFEYARKTTSKSLAA